MKQEMENAKQIILDYQARIAGLSDDLLTVTRTLSGLKAEVEKLTGEDLLKAHETGWFTDVQRQTLINTLGEDVVDAIEILKDCGLIPEEYDPLLHFLMPKESELKRHKYRQLWEGK
jgi:hypothetical protein